MQIYDIPQSLSTKAPSDEELSFKGNYLPRLRNLIATLLEQMNQSSKQDKNDIKELKDRYRAFTFDAARIQKSEGKSHLLFSIATLAISVPQIWLTERDKMLVKPFIEQCMPSIGGLNSSYNRADIQKLGNMANLHLNDYQNKTSMRQGNSAKMQELVQFLKDAFDQLARATR